MFQTMFYRRIPAARRPLMLAAAAIAALALSGCGGGGSVSSGGSSGEGGLPTEPPTQNRSVEATGVRAEITHDGSSAVIGIVKGDIAWLNDPPIKQAAPSGWASDTKQDSAGTELFRAVTNIEAGDDKDYIVYGYWSRLPVASLNGFRPVFYGTMPYTGSVRALTGNATYTGGATGVYALNPSAGSTSVDGRFTADFKLQVFFGNLLEDARVAGSLANIVTRTSDGSQGPELRDVASVFMRAISTGRNFNRRIIYGGRWGGWFYGPAGEHPTGVVGWFEKLRAARIGGDAGEFAELYGAFGVEKQ